MALNGSDLGAKIMADLDALEDADKADRAKIFEAMGNSIVEYITANAAVSVDVSITLDSLVALSAAPGSPVTLTSGSGSGSGSGTIS